MDTAITAKPNSTWKVNRSLKYNTENSVPNNASDARISDADMGEVFFWPMFWKSKAMVVANRQR